MGRRKKIVEETALTDTSAVAGDVGPLESASNIEAPELKLEENSSELTSSKILTMGVFPITSATQCPNQTVDWESQLKPSEIIAKEDGTRYATLAGLRRLARLRGYQARHVEVIQFPVKSEGRSATVIVSYSWWDGANDSSVADAYYGNIAPGPMRNYPVAIAEARAESKCLRIALGISMVTEEELADTNIEDLSGPATQLQIIAIQHIANNKNIDISLVIRGQDEEHKWLGREVEALNALTQEEAQNLLVKLNEL